jgi:NAD(P)-dependent dehydrogenase (short-subunit alcohol dehydrogenase family)
MARTALILGARNLGAAIASRLAGEGWNAVAAARSQETVDAAAGRGLPALRADAADPADLRRALGEVAERFGGLDLVVNAVSASRAGGGPFGGGPVADATLEAFRGWASAVAEQSFTFLSAGARALRRTGGGTLIQITGGSSRRAIPGRGPWAAGAFATRAVVQAAAQELRGEGIHVALLVVDATIESPKTAPFTEEVPRDALADMADVAAAVEYLAQQGRRGMTHELVITPAGDRWVP